jgi:hypothetical protein
VSNHAIRASKSPSDVVAGSDPMASQRLLVNWRVRFSRNLVAVSSESRRLMSGSLMTENDPMQNLAGAAHRRLESPGLAIPSHNEAVGEASGYAS